MRKVVSGGREIDLCGACGALWFDYGEIRELTEGRLSVPDGPEAASPALSKMHAAAGTLRCPRCEGSLTAVDFQATGVPVLHCGACDGILAPRDSAAAIHAKFRFIREHGEQYAALGETLAGEARRRMETKYGAPVPDGPQNMTVPIPMVVPLADDARGTEAFPLVTYALIAVSVFLYILGQIQGAPLPLPGGLAGLPSGTGFFGVPKLPLLFAPFFHAGILPLAAGALFLFVLGDNVEDRMGKTPYFVLYLLCGAIAGAAHILWGRAGGRPAMASAGAVAGILGAYLVFFPNVAVRMYGMGRLVRMPAYLFACAWVIAVFLMAREQDPLLELLNPSALSLAGNMAGFATGVLAAIVWRFFEDANGKTAS